MPRPKHEPTGKTRAEVESMAGFGIPEERIAKVIGISRSTLRRWYKVELELGSTKASAMVIGNLFKQATKDHPSSIPAAIFWAKTREGWREKVSVEHSGKDGAPIELELSDLKFVHTLTETELKEFDRLITKAMTGVDGTSSAPISPSPTPDRRH